MRSSIKKSALKKILLISFLVPLGFMIPGQFFLHAFNPELSMDLPGRFLYSTKPIAYAVCLVFSVIIYLAIRFNLRSMTGFLDRVEKEKDGDWRGGDKGKLQAQARRDCVRIPSLLIVMNVVLWFIGTVSFYLVSGESLRSAAALVTVGWTVALKTSFSILSAAAMSLFIDGILSEPKRLLKIHHILPGERDRFVEGKYSIIILGTLAAFTIHAAYVARFFRLRSSAMAGPSQPELSLVLLGAVFSLIALWLVVMARREDSVQLRLVESRILELTDRAGVDLSDRVEVLNFDDGGRVAAAFNRYAESLKKMLVEIIASLGSQEKSTDSLMEETLEVGRKMAAVSKAAAAISSHLSRQSGSVEEVHSSLSNIENRIAALFQAAEDQASGVVQSSAAVEEMVSNLSSISRSMESLGKASNLLLATAGKGKRKISEAVGLIGRISEMSRLLLEANSIISDVSAKTNLLSMNAAIEAAHAGEAGRGFSVVADEIRKLAELSAVQSKEVGSRLKEMKNEVDSVVSAVKASDSGFAEVLELVGAVNNHETEIRGATHEQVAGSRQVLEALELMKSASEVVKNGAWDMKRDSGRITESFRLLVELAGHNEKEASGIVAEAAEMEKALGGVRKLVEDSHSGIGRIMAEVGRFRV